MHPLTLHPDPVSGGVDRHPLGPNCRVSPLLAVLAWALASLSWGCHARASLDITPGSPAVRVQPTGDSLSEYGAWTQHTTGRIGEDLFGAPLPGGQGVVFSSNRYSSFYKLCWRPSTGSAVRRLTSGVGHDIYPAPAPDGQRMAFISTRTGAPRLFLLRHPEDSQPQRIGSEEVDVVHPSWSPDGREIAYSRLSPVTAEWEVWVVDLATGQHRFVVEGLFPEFHPRGDLLVFQRARRRDKNWFSIWTIRLDGTQEREIHSGTDWAAVNPSWSPGGEWIAFNTVARSPENKDLLAQGDNIWCVRADGEFPTRLTSRATPEWNPTWGADGRLYFTAKQADQTAIWSIVPSVPESLGNPNAAVPALAEVSGSESP